MKITWGAAVLAVGIVMVVGGYAWNALDTAADANIGAGGLVLLGQVVAVAGALLTVVALVLSRRRHALSGSR